MSEWHEPKIVGDAKNAVGYFFCLAIVTCGSLLLFGGMICPFFWNKLSPYCDEWAKEYIKNSDPTASFERMRQWYRNFLGWVLAIWFLASWAFFILVIAPQIH